MSEKALAAAMRPQAYASSTTGVKKSAVASTAIPPSMRTAAASSPSSRPTSRSCDGTPTRPRTISSSSPGGILQAHPPPWAYWVSRVVVRTVVTRRLYAERGLRGSRGHSPDVCGRRVTGAQPEWVRWGVEVSGHLVVPPVFKTGEAEHLGLAGSIPVHLRQLSPLVGSPRMVADAVSDAVSERSRRVAGRPTTECPAHRRAARPPGPGIPVSYTHLTLPT